MNTWVKSSIKRYILLLITVLHFWTFSFCFAIETIRYRSFIIEELVLLLTSLPYIYCVILTKIRHLVSCNYVRWAFWHIMHFGHWAFWCLMHFSVGPFNALCILSDGLVDMLCILLIHYAFWPLGLFIRYAFWPLGIWRDWHFVVVSGILTVKYFELGIERTIYITNCT